LSPGLEWLRPCTRPLKFSDHRKSYNKQPLNVVEVTAFYGIDLSSEHRITQKTEEAEAGSGKILKEQKRFDKICWKRTRKQPTLFGSRSRKSQE